jgi:outer membrane murein-binding lipoprotein Lpp
MKKMSALLLALALCALALAGCSSGKLPDGFVKEDVLKEAESAVQLLSAGDYDGVEKLFSDAMKSALDADALQKALGPQLQKLGKFDSVTSSAAAGGKNSQIGEFATAVLVCKYENGSATYTISIDADGKICGLYMK